MKVNFRVSGRIARPVHEVFEAVADPGKLSAYFTTGGAKGRMEPGATVMWDFHDFPGAFPVEVVDVVQDEKIVLEWGASEGATGEIGTAMNDAGYKTTVTMLFKPLDDGRTLVEIVEEGWRDVPGGVRSAFNNCEGWTGMLAAMKVWLEHGINLRDGFYR
jgi:uncharacterized protein YndB with AHSA1/START domain